MAEFDLTDVPTQVQIDTRIDALEPIFLEAHRRSEAYSRFPHARAIMMTHEEINHHSTWVRDGHLLGPSALGVASRHTMIYLWSHTLQCYMPKTPEPRDGGPPTDQWPEASPGDIEAIDALARTRAGDDIERIRDAFADVYPECATDQARYFLSHIGRVGAGYDTLIERHGGKEFRQVSELFNTWQGTDAHGCYEFFGAHLEPGAHLQRRMCADVMKIAADAAAAQAQALSALYNGVDSAHEQILDAVSPLQPGTLGRFIGKVAVNRVPFLSDGFAVADLVVEVISDGKDVDKASGLVLDAFGQSGRSNENVPTVELTDAVRDSLIELADEVLIDVLRKQRNRINDHMNDPAFFDDSGDGLEFGDASTWFSFEDNGKSICSLIPGEKPD